MGYLMSACHQLPAPLIGCWQDLNLIGYAEGYTMGEISFGLAAVLGPLQFSKFYAPVGILILGLGAWLFFRQLGLAPVTCFLGGLAAGAAVDHRLVDMQRAVGEGEVREDVRVSHHGEDVAPEVSPR